MDRSRLQAAFEAVQVSLATDLGPDLSEVQANQKDAALEQLLAALPTSMNVEDATWVAERLQGLMADNRHSLRWTQLRAKLGQMGVPKVETAVERSKLDLVI